MKMYVDGDSKYKIIMKKSKNLMQKRKRYEIIDEAAETYKETGDRKMGN